MNIQQNPSEPSKRRFPKIVVCLIPVLLTAVFSALLIFHTVGFRFLFDIYSGNNYLGTVDRFGCADKMLAEICYKDHRDQQLLDIDFSGISYRPVLRPRSRNVTSEQEIRRNISALLSDGKTAAYSVYLDGKKVGSCGDRSEAENAIAQIKDEIRNTVLGHDDSFSDVAIVSRFEIFSTFADSADISSDSIYSLLSRAVGLSDYSSSSSVDDPGENRRSSPVSADYSPITDADIGFSKNTESSDNLHLSFLNVKYTTSTALTYSEVTKYPTEYHVNEEKYQSDFYQVQEGVEGLSEFTYEITYENGIETGRELVSENVIITPTPCIYEIGTRPVPDAVPTGHYIWPLKNHEEITSYFKEVRPEFDGDLYHFGIDIAEDKGAPIMASDGGTVIFAQLRPSYGLLVIIDHGNNQWTYYGHMSKLLVKEGDVVFQGQTIGLVGMTGTATGYHLHFEVRDYGEPVDPIEYLPPQFWDGDN